MFELVVGVFSTALLATLTAFAWSPPEELKRRLLKRALRNGARDPAEANRSAELTMHRLGLFSAMALFVSAFLTGWLVVQSL